MRRSKTTGTDCILWPLPAFGWAPVIIKSRVLLYIELTISFLIGRKHTVNFEISACDVISADYTIIMSRSRVIMSSSRALCCLLSVKKRRRDFYLFGSMYNKTIIRFVFVISRIIKVSVRVINILTWFRAFESKLQLLKVSLVFQSPK